MFHTGRDPSQATHSVYDIIVIGGGIYGVSLALEATRRNLKCLLVEKGDFGEATSWNSLQIVHGGLRYLQNIDLHRFRESVTERKWFLQYFPDLVMPLKCVMPLYNRGLHRTLIFRLALLANACLSITRNRDVPKENILKRGRILSRYDTVGYFPEVDQTGLRGGALWCDAVMVNSQRVIMEILRWSWTYGASALNYVEARDLIIENHTVQGITGLDHESGKLFEYRGTTVVNCAGPWCREVARKMDRDIPQLFHPSVAFNILFDRKPAFDATIAVTPNYPGARTYFLRPYHDRIFAGTYHAPRCNTQNPSPRKEEIDHFLEDLNTAVPKLQLKEGHIVRIFSGLLPAIEEGSEKAGIRECTINHREKNGPVGLYSVSGVKFTTARLVAEKILRVIYGGKKDISYRPGTKRPSAGFQLKLDEVKGRLIDHDEIFKDQFQHFIEEEQVVHLDDLIFRRTDWFNYSEEIILLAKEFCQLFEWSEARRTKEIERLQKAL